jgi:hypothetical protein
VISISLVGGFFWFWLVGCPHTFTSLCPISNFYGFNVWRHSVSLCLVHWRISLFPPLKGHVIGYFVNLLALSSHQRCGCGLENHEGYTLCVLSIVTGRVGVSLLYYSPLSWIFYLPMNESWFSLCMHHWPQRIHLYKELALFLHVLATKQPLSLQSKG